MRREYTTPDKLCGIPVDREALDAFLPPGKKLTTHEKYYSGKMWTKQCDVLVDDNRIISASHEWGEKDSSTTRHFTPLHYTYPKLKNMLDVDHQADGGRFAYSDYRGFGKTKKCGSTLGHSEYAMFTEFDARYSEHRDANAMKSLITHFTDAVERSSDCR